MGVALLVGVCRKRLRLPGVKDAPDAFGDELEGNGQENGVVCSCGGREASEDELKALTPVEEARARQLTFTHGHALPAD